MNMLLERMVEERPSFHAWPDGKPADWSVAPDPLRFLASLLEPGMRTLARASCATVD